jgi:hypothetical protein
MKPLASLLLGALALLGASCIGEARASPPGVPEGLSLVQAAPAVGPAFVDSFTVACGAAATAIEPSGGAMVSYTCQNVSTTEVAVGDSAIADPTDGQNSPTYCATNCPSQEFGGNARKEYCRADSGTVTIYCRALVATTSAP